MPPSFARPRATGILLLATALLFSFLSPTPLRAEIVRPAPDFSWIDSTGKAKPAKELRGRPLVILIAESPRQWAFRSQVGQLQKIYQRFAADGLVCIAAFSREPGVIRSNIPFLTVADGPTAAAAFDTAQGFSISIIGMDGNLDYVSNRVVPAQRIHDIIDNSFAKQKLLRRD
ncbi:MAG: hypothetical protein ACKOLA_02465 [Spartobacteria bacterium]